jgi:hypothetical protein
VGVALELGVSVGIAVGSAAATVTMIESDAATRRASAATSVNWYVPALVGVNDKLLCVGSLSNAGGPLR